MPHIHDLVDFVVVAYIVHKDKVLLVDHRKHQMWLPVGGHIELEEDPEQALEREIQEEAGLTPGDYTVVGDRPSVPGSFNIKFLVPPIHLDIHGVTEQHRHINLVYFARAHTDQVALEDREHEAIRWFALEDLADPQYDLHASIKFYAEQALNKLGSKG